MDIGFGPVTTLETVLLGAAGGAVIVLLLLMRLRHRRQRTVGVPVVDWEARAQAAERRALEAETVVKTGLIPHLARLLRAKLVTGLLHQRKTLVEGQEMGARRAEVLEERLANAREELQGKLRNYELKVKELEEQVGAKPPSLPAVPTPAATASEPRKNPLVQRPVKPLPEPVKFGEIVARKREAKKVASAGEEPAKGEEGRPPPSAV